jgi:hypothetical protein
MLFYLSLSSNRILTDTRVLFLWGYNYQRTVIKPELLAISGVKKQARYGEL